MTLPELLITFSILGLITTVIGASVIVTMRQADATEGRLNVARSEQSVGFYMPTDLASAATVDTDPAAKPCDVCPAGVELTGSNALLLTWTTTVSNGTGAVEVRTNVSYHFAPADEPGVYELTRYECSSTDGGAYTCVSIVVLHDLTGPPGGAEFFPGGTVPTWVLQVSVPLAPDATRDDQLADASTRKDANRVVVTINGGGPTAGAGGGINQVSITAGGTSRTVIDADSIVNAPTFTQARSRCGGPITLIIDDSGSIGSAINTVEDGVEQFVEALAGTPTQIQVVRFDTTAGVVGAGSAWSRYFDMLVQADVDALLAAIPPALDAGGGTNYEDAWFRAFYQPDGSFQTTLPETVVFFTDGEPTYERHRYRASPGALIADNPPLPGPGWPRYNDSGNADANGAWYSGGKEYSQVAFDRSDWIVDAIRSGTRIIGVGVGAKIDTGTSNWIDDPGAGFHYETWRGSRQYQKAPITYEVATWRYQRGYHFGPTGARVYLPPYTNWQNITQASYEANNVTADESDGYRRVAASWAAISKATYDASNTTADESDGYRARAGTWTWISAAEYQASNLTADESDGYRDAGKQWVIKNSDAKDWELWPTQETGGGYEQRQVFAPPYTNYSTPSSEATPNQVILSRLVAGNDNAVQGNWDGTRWTNVGVAEMYVLPDFSRFVSALEAVALGECGGTVTLSTRTNGSLRTPDPITFQNSKVTDSTGADLTVQPSVVHTSRTFPAGTFDFSIPDGEFVKVDILPHNLSDLSDYSPAGWTCRVGNQSVTPELIPIPDSPWNGVRLTVRANQAVSCVLDVTR